MEASLEASCSRVVLEVPSPARAREFVAGALRSRALHRGLVTVPATLAEYDDYLARCDTQNCLSRFVVTLDADALAGVVEILDRTRAPRPCGRLAYYAFVPHAGRGLVAEAAALVVAEAFGHLGLEALTADVQCGNRRSVAVVERLGFLRDARLRARKIGRRWLEHECWRLSRAQWSSRV